MSDHKKNQETTATESKTSSKAAPPSSTTLISGQLSKQPAVILQKIMGFLSPEDLARTAETSKVMKKTVAKVTNTEAWQMWLEKENQKKALKEYKEECFRPNLDDTPPGRRREYIIGYLLPKIKKLVETDAFSLAQLNCFGLGPLHRMWDAEILKVRLKESSSEYIITCEYMRRKQELIEGKEFFFAAIVAGKATPEEMIARTKRVMVDLHGGLLNGVTKRDFRAISLGLRSQVVALC